MNAVTDRPAGVDFLVEKSDWSRHRFVDAPEPELAPGQVLFRVDRFAFTANNISYALAGDALGYWRFFPAPDGWGRLPTMGFGDVIRSTHADVAEGTRCFGFYPMSRYLMIEPSAASPAGIMDGASHREGLAPAYNQYSPAAHDALYAPEHEDALMLLRGLFMTSFLADDAIADHDHYGAESVLISSASSKTSIALGFQVSRGGRARAVGLTSPRNLEFVSKLGCYDQELTYDEVSSLDAATPSVFVDMAGSGPLRAAVHGHFGDQLRYSCSIGATHWDAPRDAGALSGPKPEFFFAPGQIQKRVAEWGPAGFQERIGAAWSAFRAFSEGWLRVQRGYGRDAVERVYLETLEGRARPEDGHVISLWDSEEEASGGDPA
jgi:NADPH:quinone reductase-like Zn-dependent oxidoreductase